MLLLWQVTAGRSERVNGALQTGDFIDLLVADVPDGLPVPNISSPPTAVPSWNVYTPQFFGPLLEFAGKYVRDHGAVLIFHPENHLIRKTIVANAKQSGFVVYKDWWGINDLRLTSSFDHSRTVSFIKTPSFHIFLKLILQYWFMLKQSTCCRILIIGFFPAD